MKRARLATALAALCLAGCAVGPNYHRPPLPPTAGYGPAATPVAEAPQLQMGGDVSAEWWRTFNCAALDALVAEALQHNQTVTAARASLKEAHETVLAQKGYYWPSVQGSINPSRQHFAEDLASPTAAGNSLYTLTTSQISVSYIPDVFGSNRRQVENLVALEEAQRFELAAARTTIANSIVAAAVEDASLRAQIDATNLIIADQRRILASLRRQFTLGQAAVADVAAQEALVAQSEATLPPLQKQLDTNRDLIAALVGRTPAETPSVTFQLSDFTLPGELPVSLPARLVAQRPDVRMADAQLHAASAAIGVAVAARLPNFDIEAAAGSATLDLGISLSDQATFWSIAATMVQPIFEGGTLLHRQRAAEAAFDQAKAQYETTVVGAFQNTADTLTALRDDSAATAAQGRAETAAQRSLTIAERQLKLGDISPVALMAAEQAEAQARLALAQARGAQYQDVAALFQALGGGWWNEPGARGGLPAP